MCVTGAENATVRKLHDTRKKRRGKQPRAADGSSKVADGLSSAEGMFGGESVSKAKKGRGRKDNPDLQGMFERGKMAYAHMPTDEPADTAAPIVKRKGKGKKDHTGGTLIGVT